MLIIVYICFFVEFFSISDLFRYSPRAYLSDLGFRSSELCHRYVFTDAQVFNRRGGRSKSVRLLPGRGLFPGQVDHGSRLEDPRQSPAGLAESWHHCHSIVPSAHHSLGQAAYRHVTADDYFRTHL